MSSDETLKSLIQKSRENLSIAQDIAEKTIRPKNVCAGHDALFGLVRAVAIGVDTSLAVQHGKLCDTVFTAGVDRDIMPVHGTTFSDRLWKVVNDNASTLIWAAAAVIMFAIATDRLDNLVDATKKIRMNTAAIGNYEPAPN